MSIIERVAQLLEPIAQPQRRHGEPQANPEVDLIERAVNEGTEFVAPPLAPSAGTQRMPDPTLARPAAGATRPIRRFEVDLDRLRRTGIITPGGERTQTAESFRRIKRRVLTNAANLKADAPANLVLVTSALAGEGKTFCAVNLAISIALEVDHSVLLVDADVRKPSFPEMLGLTAERGLMDLLVDRRIDLADVLCRTDIGKLSLLPGGTTQQNATELLASAAARELLREMAQRYRDRIIIFDSPPLLAASEAGVLASEVGQIVMVVESATTTEYALKEALGHIDAGRLTGLVLNKSEGPGLGYYGGYGAGA
jgi:exopolysaccharide/PEP-CTERM locus tyrosine autokinase